MALNPSIILSGRGIDVVGAMGRGNELAAQTNALRQTADLQNLYRTQGANIMAGDQGALNALAGFDPQAALGVQSAQLGLQGQRQGIAATQQRMDMLTREEQRQLETFKAERGAAEAAAAAAKLEEQVRMGMAIPDAASWDAFMSRTAPDLVGQFNNRQALAAKYMSMADVLKMNEAPTPLSPEGKLSADIRAGLVDQSAIPAKPPETRTARLADGSDALVQWNEGTKTWEPAPIPDGGSTAQPRDKLTETQSRLTLFQSLQTDASPILDQIEQKWNPANVPDAAARAVPIAGNFFQSREGQIYSAAAAAWAEGALRIATGAAATEPEIQRTIRTYFAQPGDLPDTVQFKNEMRASYERALRRSLGERGVGGGLTLPADFAASLSANPPGGQTPPPAEAPQPSGPVPPAFLDNSIAKTAAERAGVSIEELWENLSPETRARLMQ